MFKATTAGEVNIEEDEEVELLDDLENGWITIRKQDNLEGLVPTAYLQQMARVVPCKFLYKSFSLQVNKFLVVTAQPHHQVE